MKTRFRQFDWTSIHFTVFTLIDPFSTIEKGPLKIINHSPYCFMFRGRDVDERNLKKLKTILCFKTTVQAVKMMNMTTSVMQILVLMWTCQRKLWKTFISKINSIDVQYLRMPECSTVGNNDVNVSECLGSEKFPCNVIEKC